MDIWDKLYEKARQLLPQNRDASISEQTLCSAIAQVYFALGEKEKAVELAKAHNVGDLYSAMIGEVLAMEMGQTDEAVPYLSQGFTMTFNNIIYTVIGYAAVYRARRDTVNGTAVLQWGILSLRALKASDRPDFIDKLCAFFHAFLAGFQLAAGDDAAAAAHTAYSRIFSTPTWQADTTKGIPSRSTELPSINKRGPAP